MKPFNLEQALAGKPVVNKNGDKIVRIIHIPELSNTPYKVLVIFENGLVSWYTEDGFFIDQSCAHSQNLFMATEIVSVWINIYKNEYGHIYTSTGTYENQDESKLNALEKDYLKTIPITIEL